MCVLVPQSKGGVQKYENGKTWPVDRVVAERYVKGARQFLVLWKGYDHTFLTWEYVDVIMDKAMVRSWTLMMHADTHLAQALDALRSAIWGSVWSKKDAEAFVTVPVHLCAVGAIAKAVLNYLAGLSASTSSERPEIVITTKHRRETHTLEIDSLEHVGLAVLGQLKRPGQAYGGLAVHKGGASNQRSLARGGSLARSPHDCRHDLCRHVHHFESCLCALTYIDFHITRDRLKP
jgi:hypothetical protein